MVPGSTLRYGSSFWRETLRWRAFRMFPIDAAVIPLPSEETTPPVTKTYFDIDDLQGGFSNLTGSGADVNIPARPATPWVRPLAPKRPAWSRIRPRTPGPRAWAAAPRRSAPSP